MRGPGKHYPWLIGNGAFTNVMKGEYRVRIVDAPLVSCSVPQYVSHIHALQRVAVKIYRTASNSHPEVLEASNRVSFVVVTALSHF